LRGMNASERFAVRVATEIVAGLIGVALLACAIRADHAWLDRHFMPSFFVSRRAYVLAASSLRVVAVALGVTIVFFVRPRVGRHIARLPTRTLLANAARVLLAIALALGTSEFLLRRTFRRAVEEAPADEVPFRHGDRWLGWTFVPARTGKNKIGGRMVEYAFDSAGYRVRHAEEPVDPELPTILFAGESVMVGHGLNLG
jgi:hypothetical protein